MLTTKPKDSRQNQRPFSFAVNFFLFGFAVRSVCYCHGGCEPPYRKHFKPEKQLVYKMKLGQMV